MKPQRQDAPVLQDKVSRRGFQVDPKSKKWLHVELTVMEYGKTLELQHQLVRARKERFLAEDTVLFLEHFPVFTLGRRGGLENLTIPREFLEGRGIPVFQAERGGNITFHAPGQLVVYPILDLEAAKLGVIDYVTALEEVMIRTAAQWGVKAGRNAINRGVWVGNRKLGSVGVAIRRGVAFHGLAFNVNLALEPFSWIFPCGLQDVQMTSLELELGREVSMNSVRPAARKHMEAVFGVEFVPVHLSELGKIVEEGNLGRI